MAGMLKKNVKTESDLLLYHGEKATESRRLYHYTTYDSLLAILSGKSFRLSKTSLLNDKKEREFSGFNDCFVMSLTAEKEYISMWSMYGRASGIKTRIDFSQDLFSKCFVEKNIYADPDLKTRYLPLTPSLFGEKSEYCALKDVVYLDKTRTEYRHRENAFQSISASEKGIEQLGGFIKHDAWEFEREIRARVLDVGKADINHVYIALTNELLKDIRVTFNPWISSNMKNEISTALLKRGIRCINSDYDGQVDEL